MLAQQPTARGRLVPVIIGWHGLMVLLSAVAILRSHTISEAVLNLVAIALSVWLILMLREQSKCATLPAGLEALLMPAAIIHDVIVWPMPGGEAVKGLVALANLPSVVISVGIYLYVDRLRRHWVLT